MDRLEDPEELAASTSCQKCGEVVAAGQLQRCPWCFQHFCFNCRFPRGAADYCSGPCAEAMFHGGDGEDEAEED